MIIPGFFISIVTFPGVIVHEAAHLLFCKWRKVPVLDACFFRIGNPAGYVVHAETGNFTTSFLISMGPFIVNSLLCVLICFPAYAPVKVFGLTHPLSYVLLWFGVSIGMHAFPSMQDASNLWQSAKVAARGGNLLAIVSFPLVILVYLANFGSVFWLDYFYGLALGLGLPSLLL
ncbi:MAG: metalloprotease family protein [Kiritimatiellaeota bacterium]|nr:metalloprotease family protein [Kiritimatiellota bacterium]